MFTAVSKPLFRLGSAAAALLLAGVLPTLAIADDWLAERLRGRVFVQIEGSWMPLERGDVVSDESPIQSTASGRATFTRDGEIIEIDGGTIIQIIDVAGKKNTRVKQHQGAVVVEAEKRDVQHFSVETPYLAAVVKGTRFRVETGAGYSEVNVDEGTVEVRDEVNRTMTLVRARQSARVRPGAPMQLEGTGDFPPLLTFEGQPPVPAGGATNGAGGGSGVSAGANVGGGNGISANVSAGRGSGASANANVGGDNGASVGVSAGGGKGASANVDVGGDEGLGVSVDVGGDSGLGLGVNL